MPDLYIDQNDNIVAIHTPDYAVHTDDMDSQDYDNLISQLHFN